MKIVVLNGLTLNPGDLSWDEVKALGEVTIYPTSNREEAIERAHGADVLLALKTRIDEEFLAANPSIRYIGMLSTGYNLVREEAVKKRGIVVTNIPTYGSEAVAQHAFALLLDITNRVELHNRRVRRGEWSFDEKWAREGYRLIELRGKTMGVVGYGAIGREVARIAQAFGMTVLAHNRTKSKVPETGTLRYAELDELLEKSDVISLHMPLTKENRGMIDARAISKMKDGAILLNTSRGALIDEEALYDGLKSGKLYAAGLDVTAKEPTPLDCPLRELENCIITPHIGWAPTETRARLLSIAVDNLRAWMEGNPKNAVYEPEKR